MKGEQAYGYTIIVEYKKIMHSRGPIFKKGEQAQDTVVQVYWSLGRREKSAQVKDK